MVSAIEIEYTARELEDILQYQKKYFGTHSTKDVDFRIKKLSKLYDSIVKHKSSIYAALKKDLRKSKVEAFEGEIQPILEEILYAKKHLRSWSKPHKVKSPSFFPFSRGYIQETPYGVALIFSPYNHPFSTTFTPLVSAVAAGNCIILKPSELVGHSAEVIKNIIEEVFDKEQITVIFGGKETSQRLLELEVDTIFFTGSTNVGRVVMEAAAKKVIPVTLQLSGKCPGIIDVSASLRNAAARLIWGKFWNAGQSCNTIDHVYVHSDVKDEFVGYCKEYCKKYFTDNPQTSHNYGRIINKIHVDRISKYLEDGEILMGGTVDVDDKYIAPTLLDKIKENSPITHEEIFGPILPIFEYSDIEEVIARERKQPKALALYVFSDNNQYIKNVIENIDSGTVCINDLMIQATSPELPIGGVGNSGFGRMHGKSGFDMFSYKRSVLRHVTFDLPFRFPPYREKFLLAMFTKLF